MKEFMSINKTEITRKIQYTIAEFFEIFRKKIDDLENKAVAKINQSICLTELVKNVDGMHEYLNDKKIIEKYDLHKDQLKSKIKDLRYTYICQRRKEFDDVVSDLRDDSRKMSNCIKEVKDYIDSICNVKMDEVRIENILSKLASECILIDKQNPNFGEIVLPQSQDDDEEAEDEEKILNSNREVSSQNSEEFLSDQMNSFYYIREGTLCRKEVEDDKVYDETIMALKLHLQKVITVPYGTDNRVYLIGGAKDDLGLDAIDN